jgi:hypothetical protein
MRMPETSHTLVSQGYLTAAGSGYREMVSKCVSHYYTQGMTFDFICHIGHRADGLYPDLALTALRRLSRRP